MYILPTFIHFLWVKVFFVVNKSFNDLLRENHMKTFHNCVKSHFIY